MQGTNVYKDPDFGVKILISKPAARRVREILGLSQDDVFLKKLSKFMSTVGADYAYVSKQGRGLSISLSWSCDVHG